MYFVKYCEKLLFHSEICDFNSLIPEKQLDIKKDKSIVRKLFGKLDVTVSSKVHKIRKILKDFQSGQQTLPEVFNGTCNKALHFIRQGLLKVHKKTNTNIDYSDVERFPELEKLYTIQDFKGMLEHMFYVNDIDKLLLEAGFNERDLPYFKGYASMIKRGHRTFDSFYTELEENPNLARVVRFHGHIPNERSFRRLRDDRAFPALEVLRDLLVKKLQDSNAISFRVVAIDGKFKRSNTYAYPDEDGNFSDEDAGLCFKGTYKRGPGYMDLKLVDVYSEQPLNSIVFPGNNHESPYLCQILKDFYARYGCYPLFVVGDKAFFSFVNVLFCIIHGTIPVLDGKRVKEEDLIVVGPNHRYRKCYLGKFSVKVLKALARLRPACERFNSREENYAQGRLPTRGLKKARFWSLMAEVVSLLTYRAGITLRRKDLARCPTAFRRL